MLLILLIFLEDSSSGARHAPIFVAGRMGLAPSSGVVLIGVDIGSADMADIVDIVDVVDTCC